MANHPDSIDAPDAFGDPFVIERLPLPRPAGGYAVQYLGRDQLLDRDGSGFLPVRDPGLRALFPSFEAAAAAARDWLRHQGPGERPALAIVPASYDPVSERHILIYGVLQPELAPHETAGHVAATAEQPARNE